MVSIRSTISIVALLVLFCRAPGVFAEQAPAVADPLIEQIDLRDVKLQDAARLISEQTGLNISVSLEAGKVPISLYLRGVTARSAIEALCKSHNLWFKEGETSHIIQIMTTQEFQRDLTSFREEKSEVFTLLYPNALPVALAIRDLFGSRVSFNAGTESRSDEADDLEARFDRFDIVDQRSQGLGLFQAGGTTVTGGGGGSGTSGQGNSSFSSSVNGVGNNRFSSGNNNLPNNTRSGNSQNRDTNEEFRNLSPEQAQVIQKLIDKSAPGAETDSALEVFRRQPSSIFVTISRRNNIVVVRTSDQLAMEEIRNLIKKLDIPTALVLLEVKVLTVELSDGFNSVFDYQFSDGVNNAGGFSSGDIQPPAADSLSGQLRKAAGLSVGGSSVQSGDMIFQFVNKNFRSRIQLLESKNKVTTVATPLLMTANNEVSRLFVGEERPIIRNISSQTVVNNNTVTSTPNTTVEFRPVGTTLLITPTINSDRTVTLRLLQEDSTIDPGAATIPVVGNNGNVTSQPVDVVATRTVSGTVVAKDGLELAVGGLIQDSIMDQRAQVPGLGKVPVIGYFFRRQQTSRNKKELIVVIRPHILSTPAESECISQELLGKLSVHPMVPNPEGTMETFTPREVLRPNPPRTLKQTIIKSENVKQDQE